MPVITLMMEKDTPKFFVENNMSCFEMGRIMLVNLPAEARVRVL